MVATTLTRLRPHAAAVALPALLAKPVVMQPALIPQATLQIAALVATPARWADSVFRELAIHPAVSIVASALYHAPEPKLIARVRPVISSAPMARYLNKEVVVL